MGAEATVPAGEVKLAEEGLRTLLLARLAQDHAARLLPDGPSLAEGLRLARLVRR